MWGREGERECTRGGRRERGLLNCCACAQDVLRLIKYTPMHARAHTHAHAQALRTHSHTHIHTYGRARRAGMQARLDAAMAAGKEDLGEDMRAELDEARQMMAYEQEYAGDDLVWCETERKREHMNGSYLPLCPCLCF